MTSSFQRPSPARFVGASLECRRSQSSRAHRGRPANLIDPLAQDAGHRHEDVEIISGRGATRAALRCTIRGSATQAHREHDSHRRHSIRVVRLKGRQSLALARSRSMSGVPCVTSVVGMDAFCGRLCRRSYPSSQHSRRRENYALPPSLYAMPARKLLIGARVPGSVEFVGSFAKV